MRWAPTTRARLAHAGNGFLMRRGYTVAWLAWEGDLLPGDGRMVLDLPVATDNGRPITGPVRVEYIVDQTRVTVFRSAAGSRAQLIPPCRSIRQRPA